MSPLSGAWDRNSAVIHGEPESSGARESNPPSLVFGTSVRHCVPALPIHSSPVQERLDDDMKLAPRRLSMSTDPRS